MFVKKDELNFFYSENPQDGFDEIIYDNGIVVSPSYYADYLKKIELNNEIYLAKEYLRETDYKFSSDYSPKSENDFSKLEAIKVKRQKARDFIRDNEC